MRWRLSGARLAGATARGHSRSGCGWGRRRRRTFWGVRGWPPRFGARKGHGVPTQFRPEPVADPTRELPLVPEPLRARIVHAAAGHGQPARAAHRLLELRVRLQRRPPATGRRCGRADLPAAAGVPDSDGGQVRVAPVGGAGRRAARRGGPLRPGGLLRGRRTGEGQALGGAACAAGSRHPGRAAPDCGPAGHDGRPLRDGDRGAGYARGGRTENQAEDRRLDRHGPAGAGPGAGALRAPGDTGVPAAGTGSARHVLRPHLSFVGDSRAALPRHCLTGPQPQGADAPRPAGANGRGGARRA